MPDVAPDLVEERLRRGGIGVRQLPRELQVDRERDQLLLWPVVEVTLDLATVGIGSSDDSLSGRTELPDLEAQPVERLLRRLDVRNLQGDRPPARGLPKLSVIAWVSSRAADLPVHHRADAYAICLPAG